MRVLVGVSVVAILGITSVRAERLPKQEQVPVGVDVAHKSELGKILSELTYDRDTGKIAKIHYYSAKGAKLEDARRILVSVKSDVLSRHSALQIKESIVKSITKGTPLRPVSEIENADTILEVDLQPAARAGR